MKLSRLNELSATREMIDVFGGYNHNLRIREGEFYEMENLTSSDYPVLSPRPQRGVYKEITSLPPEGLSMPATGMIAKDALCYVDGKNFYINGDVVEGLELDRKTEKTLISMGAYVIIMPDGKYVNTETTSKDQWGYINESLTLTEGKATFTLCKLDGTEYTITDEDISNTAPDNPKDLDLWIDTSGKIHVLKQYSEIQSQWVSLATTYIKISFTGIPYDLTTKFSNNDGLTIYIPNYEHTQLKDQLHGKTMVAWEVGSNYIIVTGILDKTWEANISIAAPVSIKREMPIMDFVIESNNRLWGCRYGVARNGQIVNEIYASKLGDFKNWSVFSGISTDSYVASVGTDGQFTGAINHLGYPIFFKENCMHKVYGNYPANFQIQTTSCRGVQKGCSKSLAIVNETLYYKSRSAICAYDGSLPVEISSALGDKTYEAATAGVLGNKYYISMREVGKDYHLFVYDSQRGMWHREDNTRAVSFCNCDGELYYVDYADSDGKIKIKKIRGTDNTPVKWSATTGYLCTDSPDKKSISRLNVRLSLNVGTRVHFSIEYDSLGAWEHLFTMTGVSLRSFSVPIRPKRCDHLRLKIEGEGEAKIYSICKTIEQGSDV